MVQTPDYSYEPAINWKFPAEPVSIPLTSEPKSSMCAAGGCSLDGAETERESVIGNSGLSISKAVCGMSPTIKDYPIGSGYDR
jgi:hypothetical protein